MNQHPQDDISQKVEEIFKISSLLCAHCGELGHVTNKSSTVEYTPKTFGIHSVADWEKRMDEGMEWLRANKKEVLRVLPKLEAEWPETCKAVRKTLQLGRFAGKAASHRTSRSPGH